MGGCGPEPVKQFEAAGHCVRESVHERCASDQTM